MRLKTVFVRFYKSFNYDYLRKFKATAAELPWETIDEQWYPFVRVKMDPRVTVVVGANESGKTHLLSAIEKGITGEAISRQDFCRYSRFFTVELGKMKLPDFGFEWNDLTAAELATFRELAGLPDDLAVDRFFSFRRDGSVWHRRIWHRRTWHRRSDGRRVHRWRWRQRRVAGSRSTAARRRCLWRALLVASTQ